MTPTRVLFLAAGTHRNGGAEKVLTGLIGALDRKQVVPHVILFSEGDLAGRLKEFGIECSLVPFGDSFRPTARYQGGFGLARSALEALPKAVSAARRIRREARDFEADVIHSNGARAHILIPLLQMASISTVATLHDLPQQALESKLISFALRRADAVIANSPLVARTYLALGIPTLTIDNPVDTPKARDRAAARERFGLPIDAFVVANLAHFHWLKGQLDLVDAFARLDDDSHLVIAGGAIYGQPSRDYLSRLKERAATSKAASRIHFIGLQDDVSWIYSAADVVAHCSVRPETFGMTVVEAMLGCTPVVASSCGTPGEMLVHRETALLYEAGDVGLLTENLRALRDDPGLAGRIAEAGKSWAIGRFDPRRHAAEVTEVYESLRARARPGSDRG